MSGFVDTGPGGHAIAERLPIDDLLRSAVAGDRAARDQLLTELYCPVLRYCRRRLKRYDSALGSADDVAQEVCLAVMTALHSYVVSGRSFRAFVYAIAAHKVADAFRAMERDRTDPTAELPDGASPYDGPEQLLLARERARRVDSLLQLLPLRQRKVLILRIADGLSAEETARAIGSTAGAVRVSQHRALGRLQEAVSAGEWPDLPAAVGRDRSAPPSGRGTRCAVGGSRF